MSVHEAGDGGFQFFSLPGGRKSYFRTAPFRTLAGRRRTTVLALILIASPVWGSSVPRRMFSLNEALKSTAPDIGRESRTNAK